MAQGSPRPYQPAHGYPKAKEHLLKDGHKFERARGEWGFEEGVFVDGAFVNSGEIVHLATLPKTERKKVLAENRLRNKDFACNAVRSYMAEMRVSLDELAAAIAERLQPYRKTGA
jgi:hypothetical protein